jgi:hexosaminidase
VYARSFAVDAGNEHRLLEDVAFHVDKPLTTRYVRMEVDQYGSLPVGHNGAGHPAYFFVDEIVVK